MTASDDMRPKEPAAAAIAEPADPEVAEIREAPAAAPPNPVRKIILIALGSSGAVVYPSCRTGLRRTPRRDSDTVLVQMPEVNGTVTESRAIRPVKKGQVLFRVDPQPFEIALRKAEADLAVAFQGAGVSAVEIGVAQAALQKQRVDLAASRQLGKIVIDLVNQRALAETNAIRARADISKTQADVRRAEAELERARQNLGAAGYGNPKVQQAAGGVQQARSNLTNSTVHRAGRWRGHQSPPFGRAICQSRSALAQLHPVRAEVDFSGDAREPARQFEAGQ